MRIPPKDLLRKVKPRPLQLVQLDMPSHRKNQQSLYLLELVNKHHVFRLLPPFKEPIVKYRLLVIRVTARSLGATMGSKLVLGPEHTLNYGKLIAIAFLFKSPFVQIPLAAPFGLSYSCLSDVHERVVLIL